MAQAAATQRATEVDAESSELETPSASLIAAADTPAPAAETPAPHGAESVARSVRRRLLATAVLVAAATTILVAVPALRPVVRAVERVDPWWIAAGVLLELASCVSFAVLFRWFFEQLPAIPAHELAWTEMGSGALLPGGGIGSLAVGGWLLHQAGMPTRRIVVRSAALFFYTSATSVAALIGGGVLLATGWSHGRGGPLAAGLPIVAGVLVTLAALSVPPLMARRRRIGSSRTAWLRDTAAGISEAERLLLHPTFRALGALGYLGFDIAVLWATLAATGYHVPIATLVLGYIIGYLANLLPVPGGIGVLEGGIAGTLILYGAPAAPATAGVLIYHAISFWVPAGGGMLGYLLLRRRLQHFLASGGSLAESPTSGFSSALPASRGVDAAASQGG
jgi:uncharacterized membrane protein YbhN (UPF0104 family)